jgi:hypothetical protein
MAWYSQIAVKGGKKEQRNWRRRSTDFGWCHGTSTNNALVAAVSTESTCSMTWAQVIFWCQNMLVHWDLMGYNGIHIHIYIYLSVYTININIYICVCTYYYVHIYIYRYSVNVNIYICVYILLCTYIYIQIFCKCIYICVYILLCTYIYTDIL